MLLFAVVSLISCNSESNNDKQELPIKTENPTYVQSEIMNYLEGTWVNGNQYGEMHEVWTKENDSTFSGYVIARTFPHPDSVDLVPVRTDTLEKIQIEERRGVLYYIPAVADQNQGLPIKFKATVVSDSLTVFENPEHDFPTKISYQKIHEDSIVAKVSGVMNEQFIEEFFPFKRLVNFR